MAQLPLFAEQQEQVLTKPCLRCGVLCRAVERVNPNASMFIRGDMKHGKLCGSCLIVSFMRCKFYGLASAMGEEYFDPAVPQPEWRKEVGDPDARFDPECLRDSDFQQDLLKIIFAAQQEFHAELQERDIDWDAACRNWHLPFPEGSRINWLGGVPFIDRPKRRRRKGQDVETEGDDAG